MRFLFPANMPSVTESQFAVLLERRLAPVLRVDAFAGEGWEWSRLRNPVVNCIQIQARSDHFACCVNLGVHLTFLPVAGGSSCSEWTNISEPECEIKERLAWKSKSDHWWMYKDAEDAASDLVACYLKHGRAFFDQFDHFPHPFVDIVPDEVGNEAVLHLFPVLTKVRMVLLLARVHEHLGNVEKAVQFSQIGKEIAGPAAGPKAAFRELLRKYQ